MVEIGDGADMDFFFIIASMQHLSTGATVFIKQEVTCLMKVLPPAYRNVTLK